MSRLRVAPSKEEPVRSKSSSGISVRRSSVEFAYVEKAIEVQLLRDCFRQQWRGLLSAVCLRVCHVKTDIHC